MTLVKKILTLIVCFIIIDMLISTLLSNLSDSSSIRYSRLYNENINADILFAGNSRGINSFYVPYFNEKTGLKSFNLSYNGLSIPLVKVFIDDYLELNNAPKIIFLEVTCLNMSLAALPNFKQYFDNSSSLRDLIKESIPEFFYLNFITKSYKFNSEFFLRSLYYLTQDDQKWINRYTIKKEYYESLERVDKFYMVHDVDIEALQIFKSMVDEYHKKGITVIPVLAPIIDKYRNEEDIDKYLNDIKLYTNLEVVDLSNAITDINMFADAVHTNVQGANLIVDSLIALPEVKVLNNRE
jgi:hypothetical protein